MASWLAGRRGVLAAALVAAVALAVHEVEHRERLDGWSRNHLPAFDAYVYAAMAEHPTVFTLAPWGFRLLVPGLASLLPVAPATAFRIATPLALAVAAVLLFVWLRRLGHRPALAVLGTAALAWSPPVEHAHAYSVLVEPFGLALEMAFLLALQAGAGAGWLALVLLLATATKEVLLLLLLPLALFRAPSRLRDVAGLPAIAAPSIVFLALVRWWWAPYATVGEAGATTAAGALSALSATASEWGPALLVGGITPLALLGALRPEARPLLRRYGWILGPGLALPFAAGLYVPGAGEPTFFAADVERLLIYPLPVLVALALHGLEAVARRLRGASANGDPPADASGGDPAPGAPAIPAPAGVAPADLSADAGGNAWAGPDDARAPSGWPGARGAWLAALLLAVAPLLLDRYRRLDLQGPRDGPRVLALTRGTLATARRLAAGRPVIWRFPGHGYQPVKMAPEYLDRARWFLLDGWGPAPHYGLDPVVLQADRVTLLLPVSDPAMRLGVSLHLTSARPLALTIAAGGAPVARLDVPAGTSRLGFQIPPGGLFRGDNAIVLHAPGAAAAGLTVEALGYRGLR